jgi:hypothetical protein
MAAIEPAPAKPFSWARAITAGLIATIAITISLALFGTNIMKSLGSMMLPNGTMAMQYLAGGIFHLMVGLFYGVVYASLFGKVREWNPVFKGAVFGLAITAIALAVMPIMGTMMPGGAGNPCNPLASAGAANPCNPCGAKAANPCNPCAAKATNPCNSCAPKAQNPCNPCAAKAQNPCNPCAAKAANPCGAKNACGMGGAGNPCNPCGGPGPYSGLISAMNHLIYGLALALVYGTRPAA